MRADQVPAQIKRRATSKSRPRQTSGSSSSRGPVTRGPAPKPASVLTAPVGKLSPVGRGTQAKAKVQAAEERMPGTTLPVKRFPVLAKPSVRQQNTIVREQTRALQGSAPQAVADAKRGLADKATREQLAQVDRALPAVEQAYQVKRGLQLVRENPRRFASSDAEAAKIKANVAHKVTARLPAKTRATLAAIGAADTGGVLNVKARELAPGERHKGGALLATVRTVGAQAFAGHVAAAASTAATRVAPAVVAVAKDAAGDATKHLNAGVGVDPAGLPAALVKDAIHLPYDAVNAGVQLKNAAGDLLRELPKPLRVPLTAAAGPLTPVFAKDAVSSKKGSTDKAKAIVGALDDGFVGALAAGDLKLAADRFVEHPLYSGMEVAGVYGGAGRVAGAVMRSGLAGAAAKGMASTARADLQASRHGGLTEQRSYSKNALTMAVQKRLDARDVARGRHPNVAGPMRADWMESRGPHEDAAAFQDVSRNDKNQAALEAERAVRGGRARPARKGSMEGSIRAVVMDTAEGKLGNPHDHAQLLDGVRQERARVADVYETEHTSMTLGQRRSSLRRQGALEKIETALAGPDGPKVAAELARRSDATQVVAHDVTSRLNEKGVLVEGQADNATLRSFATSRGGLHYDPTKAMTADDAAAVQDARAVRKGAKQDVRAADEALMKAKVALGGESARVRLRQAQRRQKILGSPFAKREGRWSKEVVTDEAAGATRQQRVLPGGWTQELTKAGSGGYRVTLHEPDGTVHELKNGNGKVATADRAEALRLADANVPDEAVAALEAAGRPGLSRAERVTAYIKAVEDGDRPAMQRLARQEAQDQARVEATRGAVAAAKAGRKGARQALRDSKVPAKRKFTTGLVDENGRKVTLDEVRAMYEAEHGPGSMPAFVSHREMTPEAARFVNWFNSRGFSRKAADVAGKRRTGESARRGTNDPSAEALVSSQVHSQGVLSAAENFDRALSRYGSVREDGKPFTPAEADEVIRQRVEGYNAEVPEREWVAVRAAPGRYGTDQLAKVMEGQDLSAGAPPVGMIRDQLLQLTDEELRMAAQGKEQRRDIVLMPKKVMDEFAKLQDPTKSEVTKAAQAITGVFRGTVLPTSTKWLFGNVAEAMLRLAIDMGPAAPVHLLRAKRVLAELEKTDAEAAKMLRARVSGGGVYGAATRMNIMRNASMFQTPVLGPAAKALSSLARAPFIKQVLGAYRHYASTVIGMNKWFEEQGQLAVMGKAASREMQDMGTSWARSLGWQGKAFEALMAGDRVKAAEFGVRAARDIDRTLGKYNRFSPELRRIIQTAAPFLPWYLNAARFVYWTLPVEHPVKGAVLGLVERAFDSDMEAHAGDLPPGSLGAGQQDEHGGITPWDRYTPFGAFTGMGREGEKTLESLVDPLYPQFTTPVLIAVFNQNFSKRPLKKADGTEVTQADRAQMAAYAMFESVVPFMQIIRRVREGGKTGADDSKIWDVKTKPGTAHGRGAPERIFVPWSKTYLQAGGDSLPATASAPPAAATPADPAAAILQYHQAQAKGSAATDAAAAILRYHQQQGP